MEKNHTHQDTKKVINRMSRAIGHLESIKRMIEEGEDCSKILIQLSAVRSAINNVGKIILLDHMNHCVVDAVKEDDEEVLKEFNEALNQFLK
ncbi:metal-sensing transcriptional repressor [Gallicola sp. Sow4_E12]|uniref:metal-sensing transcriptional repressor n=1 Tax=Gallicola sp. Sow4_E12 TaxID=3438785 RepID=UPI003F8E786F